MNKRCQKLLLKAQNSANNLRFNDLCKLAECFGWQKKNQEGSHVVYKNDALGTLQGCRLPFQDNNGKAVPYQVRQLLTAIGLLDNNNDK